MYAQSGQLHIAYQVLGEGPLDLVMVPGFVSHVEQAWEIPQHRHFMERLAPFARVITFDKRGTGASDRVPVDHLPLLEERMDDVRAVMDAAGSQRAALLGMSEGTPMSILFAATYPERTSALILLGGYARQLWAEDYPFAVKRELIQVFIQYMSDNWGKGAFIFFAPSLRDDQAFVRRLARYETSAASPGAVRALLESNSQIDVRQILPTLSVPTLVLHTAGDRAIRMQCGLHLAENIPNARFVELEGIDHWYCVVGDPALDEIEEFLTGHKPVPEPERVLATVLYTDIVSSTEITSELGDRRWLSLLEKHNEAVRSELERFRGREIKTLGDGFLAVFDGPARATRAACAIREAANELGLAVRAGVHTGECELVGDDVGGIAINIGARVVAKASANEVLVSSTVKDLVAGSGLVFEDRGVHALKGVPGEWRLYSVLT